MGFLKIFNKRKRADGRHIYLQRDPVIIPAATHRINKRKIDRDALNIVTTLQKNRYTTYLVGGCVRDLLIGREPKDFDIVSNAQPRIIKRIFPRARIIGRRFKLVHIQYGDRIYETATFRALPENEKESGDESLFLKRDNIFGTDREDAVRRDFTINGLFYDPVKDEIVDYVDGYRDIQQKIIRIIGNPDVSYREDPVRMLRACKFQGTTGFSLEKKTENRIRKYAPLINDCSQARIIEEIYKIMRSGASLQVLFHLQRTGLLQYLIPEVYRHSRNTTEMNRFAGSNLGQRLAILDSLTRRGLTCNNPVFLSVLLHDSIQEIVSSNNSNDIPKLINDYLTELSVHMGFSRRDRETVSKIPGAIKRLRNSRQKSAKFVERMVTRDYFKDALDIFEIECRLTGSGSDQLLFWKDQYSKQLPRLRRLEEERIKERRKKNNRRNRPRRRMDQ